MHSTRRALFSVALLAAALSVTNAAYAAGPSAADRETARTLMEQGRELRNKGNMLEALKRFQGANNIMHVPTTALELARAQVALKMFVEARDTIGMLRQMPSEHDSKVFQAARAAAEEARRHARRTRPRPDHHGEGGRAGAGRGGRDRRRARAAATSWVVPRTVNPGTHVVTAKTPRRGRDLGVRRHRRSAEAGGGGPHLERPAGAGRRPTETAQLRPRSFA